MSSEIIEQLYVEDEEMADSNLQFNLIHYLVALLRFVYRAEGWFISGNLKILPRSGPRYTFANVAPDIAFFKGVVLSEDDQNNLTSWDMKQPNRPAPAVVFEICSEATWTTDVLPLMKPDFYRQLGVKEYFTFDPQGFWTNETRRLRGWRYPATDGAVELVADEQGRLWSDEMESWLVPDGVNLWLFDHHDNRRLSEAETERQAREVERQALVELRQKLRDKGYDPDNF